MKEKSLNFLIISYIFSSIALAVAIYGDFYGVYNEYWEGKFRNLAIESGNNYPNEIGSLWEGLMILYFSVWTISIVGIFFRRLWAAMLFVICVAAGLLFSFSYPATVDYNDKLVEGINSVNFILEGAVCAIILLMRREVGFLK